MTRLLKMDSTFGVHCSCGRNIGIDPRSRSHRKAQIHVPYIFSSHSYLLKFKEILKTSRYAPWLTIWNPKLVYRLLHVYL